MAENVRVCDIDPELKEQLRQFRFRKDQNNAALIMKVDKDHHTICVDEVLEHVGVDELREALPERQPRYIVYSYRLEHDDGRISFPMVFIFSTPRDCKPELQMMYAGTKLALVKEAELTKVFEIRELEELTEDWLQEKLKR
ncbi:unnamed protein product [Darwinula stevensoni]|uniref:ADF-H domain-containing protein n=1 Tax=Darwinula stevensoni TaxID=69355 RepID=A0A7R8X340_9CRUS|nr:unnamed protein product [Darwinula stevensoni]CAG0883975.1 unnamed protein product [Darwinula stevensoni]